MCSSLSSQGDEDGIYQAVGSVGPVSICFDVTMGFQLYKKGVYSRYGPIPIPVWNEPSCCSDMLYISLIPRLPRHRNTNMWGELGIFSHVITM